MFWINSLFVPKPLLIRHFYHQLDFSSETPCCSFAFMNNNRMNNLVDQLRKTEIGPVNFVMKFITGAQAIASASAY